MDEPETEEMILSVTDACKRAGISRATLYRRIDAGLIKPLPHNPALFRAPLRFKASDVDRLKDAAAASDPPGESPRTEPD